VQRVYDNETVTSEKGALHARLNTRLIKPYKEQHSSLVIGVEYTILASEDVIYRF